MRNTKKLILQKRKWVLGWVSIAETFFDRYIKCILSFLYNDNQEAVLFGIACFGLGKYSDFSCVVVNFQIVASVEPNPNNFFQWY